MKYIFNKFRKPIMFFIDLALISLSVYLAFMIRFDWQLSEIISKDLVFFMIWASILRVVIFIFLVFTNGLFVLQALVKCLISLKR